ncbi:hypothetical protein A0H81_10400 [Grifola frondosa]|uniref:Uncharacterized protein n=1 Tax=Grifola frondosa TaxID=5627 RepID=A0A1C7LYL5_GRIFR|nr:hypothetical protein A0H81_10400 [Grifola frondosa]
MNIDEDITPPELLPHVAAVEATNHIAPKADHYEDDEPHIPNDPSVMPTVEEVLEGIVTEVEEVLDVLHEASREEEDIDVTSVAGDTSISFSMEYQVEEVVTEGRTQESEIGRTFADQSRSPSPTYLQSITDYVVTETDDISLQSDRGISESPDDVVSLHSDAGTVEIDYTVEEPHTEGHRTPSPEYSAPMASFDVPMAESSDNSVKPIVTPSAIPPSRSERVAEEVTNAPQSQDEHPRPDQEVDVVEAKAIASSGIPMPVSADPTVPDPTSISHTPVSPSPANSESGRDESPSAAFSLSETASPGFSGLFTPLPDGGSEHSTASSEDADLETNDLAGSMTVPETSNARECDEYTATPIADQVESIPSITEEGKNTTLKENVDEADGAELPDLPEVASTNVTLETSRSVEASTEKPVSQRPAGGSKASRDAELPGDVDADADGELDPDYVAHHNDAVLPEPVVEEEKALKITETDPFRLMGSDSKVAPGAVEDIPVSVGHEVTENTEDLRASAKPRDASPNGSAKSENDDHLREPTSPVKTTPQSDVDQGQIPDSSTRNLKRKRESPPILPPRLTRSMAAKGNLVDQLRSPAKAKRTYTRKAKGKQKAEPAIDAEDRASASQDSEGASIKSGASIPKLDGLVPFSRHTSRSSSIVSNTPSTQSADTIPSPTLTRMPPPPFVQGILHHHHGRPAPAAAQTTQQRTVVRPQPHLLTS